jgi:hypothetical protein
MSWNELERLVEEAEADGVIRRSLRHCRSREELVLASRRLGYRITRQDLGRAWCLHRRELEQDRRQAVQQGQIASHPGATAGAALARETTVMDVTVTDAILAS